MLGNDGMGQAPNMSIEDGSLSPVNMMSDMEFYALGCYLGSSQGDSLKGGIHESPSALQSIILEEWLYEYYPEFAADTDQPKIDQLKTPGERRLSDTSMQQPLVGRASTNIPGEGKQQVISVKSCTSA